MNTLQGMMMRTNYMIEEIRRSAIDETIERFKQASRHYYETSEGGADTTKYIHELVKLGVDIGVEVETMIQAAQKKGKKILIGIDEVSKSEEMIKFASEYGRWLRAGYPVYFVCTGLYENIQELSNVKNLTFFRRAATVKTEPLNMIRMTEMYKSKLDIDSNEAREMAKITKGYAYAFQELGVLYFKKKLDELLEDILPKLKAELFAYSYEKIWEEMTEMDRFLAGLLTEKEEYKREEVLKLMGEKSGSYSMYRDRLIKRGILNSRQGYISLALPYFGEYIKEYC